MANNTWLGTTNDAFTTAGNWSGGVPADNDVLFFDDQAVRSLLTAIDSASIGAKAFEIIVSEGFQHHIGASGAEFTPGTGLGLLYYAGSGLVSNYFKLETTDTCEHVILDTSVAKDDILIIKSDAADATWDKVTVKQGKGKLDAAVITSGGRIQVSGGPGNSTAELSIPSGSTLTGTVMNIDGGKVTCGTAIVTASVNGGELVIEESANAALLEMTGGTVFWDADASSTITLASIMGGTLKARKNRAGRTLTNMDVFAGGKVDFKTGGLGIVFTNPPRMLGGDIIMPVGTTYTFGV